MNNFYSFFKLMWFEIIKIARNPVLLCFLLLFPFVSVIAGDSISQSETTHIVYQNEEDGTSSPTILNDYISFAKTDGKISEDMLNGINTFFGNENKSWSTNLDEQLTQLKLGNIIAVVFVDTTKNPNNIIIYYDSTSVTSTLFQSEISIAQMQYTIWDIADFFADYGVTIDVEYFSIATFQSSFDGDVTMLHRYIPLYFGLILGLIIVFGLSYSMARDNETGVIKQLSYTPLSTNKYLLIRATLFLFLGIIQSFIIFVSLMLFNISWSEYTLGTIGLLSLFSCAVVSFGLMCACTKNQISALSIAIVVLLLPTLILYSSPFLSLPLVFQIILLFSPITPQILLVQSYYFYGIVDVKWIILLCIQVVIYYIIAYIITKKKTKAHS